MANRTSKYLRLIRRHSKRAPAVENTHLWVAPVAYTPDDTSTQLAVDTLRSEMSDFYGESLVANMSVQSMLTLLSLDMAMCRKVVVMSLAGWKAASELGLGLTIELDDHFTRLDENKYAACYWRRNRCFMLIGDSRQDAWRHDNCEFYVSSVESENMTAISMLLRGINKQAGVALCVA